MLPVGDMSGITFGNWVPKLKKHEVVLISGGSF